MIQLSQKCRYFDYDGKGKYEQRQEGEVWHYRGCRRDSCREVVEGIGTGRGKPRVRRGRAWNLAVDYISAVHRSCVHDRNVEGQGDASSEQWALSKRGLPIDEVMAAASTSAQVLVRRTELDR